MNSVMQGGGRLPLGALALGLGIWAFSGPAAVADDIGLPGNGLFGGPRISGTLGYGAPGLFPGFQGFGLGYHPGYGYGGDALGTGAEGGYPFYGGPGYPHPWPTLRRVGGINPFPYFGGPGAPTPDHPNYFGGIGPLAPDQPVVTISDQADDADYGCFTGAIPYPEAYLAPFTARAAAAGSSSGVITPAPDAPSTNAAPAPGFAPSPSTNAAPAPGSGPSPAQTAPTTDASADSPVAGRSLGIDAEPVVDAGGVRGMKVFKVYPGSAAEKAELLPGDVIHSINGYVTENPGSMAWIIANAAPDSVLMMKVRTTSERKVQIVKAQIAGTRGE